jgi:hypothetical protein
MRMREADVVVAVETYITELGFHQVREFPLLGKIADVFAFHSDADVCLAVECKERDWRGALRQAVAYQAGADLVFVAIPAVRVTDFMTQQMSMRGIGVMAVAEDGLLEVTVPAASPRGPIPVIRERAISRLSSIARGDV